MQQEELAFLRAPEGSSAIGIIKRCANDPGSHRLLDFFGVDCALDASGDLVVFEANASMLVHDQNANFSYKGPFVQH